MKLSFKLKIDTYDPRKDGTCAVYFQVIIKRKKKRVGLDISWPPKRFNKEGCLERFKGDPDAAANNILIQDARTKANEIRRQFILRQRLLTLDAFLQEYNSNLSKDDFIHYIERKSFDRWNKKEISDQTYSNEKVVINHLKKFQTSIPFNSFDIKWAKRWDKFLEKPPYNNDINTRWGKHKVVTTYLTMARDYDNILFDDPYSRFVNRTAESSWGPLDLVHLKKLVARYQEWRNKPLPFIKKKRGAHQEDTREGLTLTEVRVLRRFLFSCNSALRMSDLAKLDETLFTNGQMSITPHKTERFGTQIKSIPLNAIARELLNDEIADVHAQRQVSKTLIRIFEKNTSQYSNRILKRIAKKCDINVNLHMHVGRYTFGSLSDEAGANHTALMKQMGIRKRETLEKYVKTSAKAIDGNVEKLNAFLSPEGAVSGKESSTELKPS